MRLTAELIHSAPTYINPLSERELGLRGFQIPAIENLGVTQDQYECIDLCDNEIIKIANFPLLTRLQSLLLSNNRITLITPGLGRTLPNLADICLTKNKLSDLASLVPLRDFPKLTELSLIQNPVTKRRDYRLFVIHQLPQLKILDFKQVKPQERERANAKFGELEERNLDEAVLEDKKNQKKAAKKAKKASIAVGGGMEPTQQQRKEIMEKIKNAKSFEEITRLENLLDQMKGAHQQLLQNDNKDDDDAADDDAGDKQEEEEEEGAEEEALQKALAEEKKAERERKAREKAREKARKAAIERERRLALEAKEEKQRALEEKEKTENEKKEAEERMRNKKRKLNGGAPKPPPPPSNEDEDMASVIDITPR